MDLYPRPSAFVDYTLLVAQLDALRAADVALDAECTALIERAGTAAWAAHHAHTHPEPEPEPERYVDAVEHGDLDALRVAYADAVVRNDRRAIADTARRIVALHISGVHR